MISVVIPAYNAQDYIREAVESIIAQSYGDWELIVVDDYSSDRTVSILSEYSQTKMNISVIVPIYSVESYIERCLRSLFTQTKTDDVEFILVNDCTPDDSMVIAHNIAKDYPRLNIIFIDKTINEGLAKARQSGVDKARGEYIVHIDGDDWCERTMLEELSAKAAESGADIVVCDYYFDRCDEQLYIKSKLNGSNIECIGTMLINEEQGAVWNKMYRRGLYIENNIHTEIGVNMWEDIYLNTMMFSYAKVIEYLPKAFLHYMRDNNNSLMRSNRDDLRCRDMLCVVGELDLLFANNESFKLCDEALNYRKASLKLLCVESSVGERQREYMSLFPELKRSTWGIKKIKIHKKILLFLVNNNQLSLFNWVNHIRTTIINFVK